jgi:hypothetical protein
MPAWILISMRMLYGGASPRSLPASTAALLEAAALYAIVSVVDAALVVPGGHAIGLGLADLGFLTVATAGILATRRRLHRWRQTLLALLGVGIWLTLPSIVLNAVWSTSTEGDAAHHAPLAVQLLLAAVLCGSIGVVARIFRDALDVDLHTAVTVSLTYFLADYAVLVALPARILN